MHQSPKESRLKNLTRRKFLKKSLIGTAALSPIAACTKKQGANSGGPAVHTGQVYHWKMITTWPKNFPALGTGAEALARNIEKLSAGRIKVHVYGAGELVPALEVFDAVSRGTAELGHSASYYWRGKHAASQFFAAVPFGMTTAEADGWLLQGGGQALWDELYAGFGLKPFLAGNTGTQMGGWFKRPVQTVADFKGLKIRIPGLGGEVLQNLGAAVVNLPGGEIFQSLQSGAIDASEWIGPYNDLAFGLHQAASHYYWPGWQEPSAALECLVNKKAYEGLPSDLQAVVEAASLAANTQIYSEFTARNAEALQTLVEKHKVKVLRFSDEILRALQKTSQELCQSIAGADPFSKKVYESYQRYQASVVGWSKIAEQGFMTARG